MDKRYENRYWETEDYNGMIVGKLHFTQFYEDEIILSFQQDKDDKETFWYVSDFLRVEVDCISADTLDEAMEEFESMIIERIEDEICTLEDMKQKFNEEIVY
jgi:hypothetical protein